MASEEKLAVSVKVLDSAASELSKLGFDNMTISEIFFAYGLRVGLLVDGCPVLGAARMVIDGMEKSSRAPQPPPG
jgi:hypothetical protein